MSNQYSDVFMTAGTEAAQHDVTTDVCTANSRRHQQTTTTSEDDDDEVERVGGADKSEAWDDGKH